MEDIAVKGIVTGRVQGVWFRVGTQKTAQKLGLRGYVRNLPTGQVEFVAIGAPEKVQSLVMWAHDGTPFARVESVDISSETVSEEFCKFEIRG